MPAKLMADSGHCCILLLLLCVTEDCGRLHIYAILLRSLQDGSCEARLQILWTVAEICFCGSNMFGVGHWILAALWKSEYAIGQFLLLFV